MKKPSEFCGMADHGYLGHFKNPEVLCAGHNTSEKNLVDPASEKRRADYAKQLEESEKDPKRKELFKSLRKAFE